jgi:hypothetical protein
MNRRRLGARCAAGLVVLAAAACGPDEEIQRQLAELQVVSAQKDSLIMEVTDNAQLMSEISAEVARVQSPTATVGGREAASRRDQLLVDIRSLTSRIEESETRLQESQARIDRLGRDRAGLSSQVAQVREAMTAFEQTVAHQRTTIVALEAQVANLQEQNVVLAAEKAALEDTVVTMITEAVTVYYTVGSKDELVEHGLVTEEGGSRVLFVFGKRGKTLVPARGLNPADFTAIDMRDMREIYLPEADAGYVIVTHQDLSALETPPDEEGRIFGSIRISDPERFWVGNPFLIVVRVD